MKVNGLFISLNQVITLQDFLMLNHYEVNRIAVERNGMIVPKANYADTILKDTDTLEIVRFVGGG